LKGNVTCTFVDYSDQIYYYFVVLGNGVLQRLRIFSLCWLWKWTILKNLMTLSLSLWLVVYIKC